MALRWGAIIPSGILIFGFAFLSPMALSIGNLVKLGFWGAYFMALATILMGIFPCDAACNPELINPSASQVIHNLFAGLTYLMVPLCILLVGVKSYLRVFSLI